MNKQRISFIMTVVFALLFLLSARMLLAYYGESVRQQQAFRALERITEQANDHGAEKSENAAVQTEQSAEEKAAQEYNALKEKNPDFWGWIKIDDTALSYPVMHTPEEPEYYLRRDFEGVLFTARCTVFGRQVLRRLRQLHHLWSLYEGWNYVWLAASLCKACILRGTPHYNAEYRRRMRSLHGNGGVLFTGLQARGYGGVSVLPIHRPVERGGFCRICGAGEKSRAI